LWDEVVGISRYTGIPAPVVASISAIYDLTASHTSSHHACSGIVAQNSAGGILHGRTLDYGLKEAMENITIVVDFERNSTTQYLTPNPHIPPNQLV